MPASNNIEMVENQNYSGTDSSMPRKPGQGKRLAIGIGIFFLLAAIAAVAVVIVCKYSFLTLS